MLKWNGIPLLLGCLILTAGCAGDPPAPDPNATSGSAGSTTGGSAEVPLPADDGPAEDTPPDGNTEPPLTDVTRAVETVPPADSGENAGDSGEVSVKVVTPEDFDALIAQHKGKVVLVDFWATWCVPCRKAFPHTIDLANKHSADDLVVISMSFDDAEIKEDVVEFLTESKATITNLMCTYGGGDESFSGYDIGDAGLPYYRVYGRDGSLKQAFKNADDKGVDETEVYKLVEDLLAAEQGEP